MQRCSDGCVVGGGGGVHDSILPTKCAWSGCGMGVVNDLILCYINTKYNAVLVGKYFPHISGPKNVLT